jgi:hypothetical protein
MRIALVLCLLLWASPEVRAQARTQKASRNRIDDAIARTAISEPGEASREYFRRRTALVDADQVPDSIALFTVEGMGGGGTASAQFLAISTSSSGFSPVVVGIGGRLDQVDSVAVRDRRIIAYRKVARRGDPLCCPSRTDVAAYLFKQGKLIRTTIPAR